MALAHQYFSRVHVERVIGGVRVALASASLFGVWLNPAEPQRLAPLTYSLHATYVAYSIVVALVMWRRDSVGRLPLVTHVTDIVSASTFQYLTLGPSSPFFIYFVFALFSAALRWGWRETVRTAAAVLIAYIVMAASLSRTLGPAEFERSRFIIRVTYLVVVTVVLAYLGQHEEHLRDDVRRLARWPQIPLGGGADTIVPRILEHSARIVGAGRSTVVWTKDGEPRVSVASWPHRNSPIDTYPRGDLDPLVPHALADSTFMCRGPFGAGAAVTVSDAGTSTTWTGQPVHSGLLQRLGGPGLASTPFRTEHISGRAFFTDLKGMEADQLPLVEVVGRELGGVLEQIYLYARSKEIAVIEDRVRVARDLHDGVLQSLMGIRFELQRIARGDGGEACPPLVKESLLGIERAIALDQSDLRHFVENLGPASSLDSSASLTERLDDLCERMVVEWRVPIAIRVRPPDLVVPGALNRSVPLMIHEGIANALKHAHPSRVSVDVHSADRALVVVIEDDGRGFSFRGRQDHAALSASNAGPISLRERVTSLGGKIAVESSPAGSRVELSIPFGPLRA